VIPKITDISFVFRKSNDIRYGSKGILEKNWLDLQVTMSSFV